MRPLLSIIIPTRNRYEVLIPVIDAFLDHIIGTDYEIVVQDNSDNNNLWLEYSLKRHDNKIKYFYEAEPLTMKDNTNRAFENSNGEYWIFMGDDDFVSPYILDVVKMMQSEKINALIYTLSPYYWWTNVKFEKEDSYMRRGAFLMPNKINTELIKKDTEQELDNLLYKHAALGLGNIPRLYNGIVKSEVMENIKERMGDYLVGSCPDLSLSISLALTIDYCYYLDYPVGVFGKSGIRHNAKEAHFRTLDNVPFLPENIQEIWSKDIPPYWCDFTMWPQTAYETLNAFQSNKRINFVPMYASIIIRYSQEKVLVMSALKLFFRHAKFNILKYFEFMFLLTRKVIGKIYYKIIKVERPLTVTILPTANDVMKYLKQFPFNK